MKTAKRIRALLSSPVFKKVYLDATRAFTLMKECERHDLFDELVAIEDMTGLTMWALAKELKEKGELRTYEMQRRLQIV